VVVVVLGLVALAVYLATNSPGGISFAGNESSLTKLQPLFSVLVGAIIIHRKGNHPVGWLFLLSGLAWAIYYLGFSAGEYVIGGHTLFGSEVMIWSTTWSSYVGFGLAPVLVVFIFPSGRLTSPAWRWFFRFAILSVVAGAVAYALAPGALEDLTALDNPYGIGGAIGEVADFLMELSWMLLLVALAGGVVSLRQKFRRASQEERQQIKWMLFAGAAVVAFVFFWGMMEIFGNPEIAATGAALFLPLLPLAVGTAILKYRLYDIDVFINRTLVYGALTAVLALFYLGAVVVFQGLLSPITAKSDLAIAASTLSVAALFRPARERIQRFIDRRFYRQKYDAAATLATFSARLRDEIDLDALTAELLAVVGDTMKPSYAGVWLKESSPES
jgi:hypothetical protein